MAFPLLRTRPTAVIASLAASGVGTSLLFRYFARDVHADAGPTPNAIFGRGPAFVSLPLESSELVNHNTKRLRFKLPHETDISGLSLTSAVLTLSWPKGRWMPVARPYTPISKLDEPGILELLVKHYPDGKQSTHLHSLRPGDKLLFAAALRGYQWRPSEVPHMTLIAGGAGITPIYQLAQGILSDPEDETKITLVYGVNTDHDVLLGKEFKEFEKTHGDRFKIIHSVSRPDPGSTLRKGYVGKELLEELTPGSKEGEKVFVCGPPAMEASLVGSRKEKGILEQLGYRKDQIHTF
ncbi:NADH-cytochrome b5 reductase [Lophiotrema nucula]|uniref:NADH-cytochrome b5 reductase n=1 Tax=Lophiotrema nucula TaxID=690887 RepID=A0A6A5YL10_9PLEO|nr:NADH-cytochrome b5 reductase [Lophiotrema nucula]